MRIKAVGKPGGLFVDDRVTNTAWAGKVRKTRMVIYRYAGNNETDTLPVMQDENDDYESRIRELGIKLREAVEIENYEEAARLRDMIHQLKKMDNTDDSTQGGGHDA